MSAQQFERLKRLHADYLSALERHDATDADGAADEIAAMTDDVIEEIERLRNALEPFAQLAHTQVIRDGLSFGDPRLRIDITRGFGVTEIHVGAFAAAKDALNAR